MESTPNTSVPSIIEVQVVEVLSSGLRVKILETGKKGFIPRREITWERRISIPVVFPKPGEKINAALFDDKKRSGLTLSLRRVTNPWLEKINRERKYKKDDIIVGEVVNVRHFGAYVQLEPGIDGVIYPREATFLIGQNIEDILWVGDKVQAEIIDFNRVQQRKVLSKSVNEQADELLTVFGKDTQLTLGNKQNQLPNVTASRQEKFSTQQIRKLSRLLIVDDEKEWQDKIKTALMRDFRTEIDIAKRYLESCKRILHMIWF